jgi:hypothetical protein
MKNSYLLAFIFPFFVSCSPDGDNIPDTTKGMTDRITGLYPENSANAFDGAGQLHNDISEAFLAGGYSTASIQGTITTCESLASSNVDYMALKEPYTSPDPLRLDYIINNEASSMADIIANSPMTSTAKTSLTTFINTVMSYQAQQKEYDLLYQYIITYETAILADSSLTATDRKIILTTSSISRYAFYFASKHKQKPRDRDWDISIGNIVAGTEGAHEGMSKAIIMSAAVGLTHNIQL